MRMHQVALLSTVFALSGAAVLENRQAESASQEQPSKNSRAVSSLDVEIATTEAGDEKLERGIYIFHLKCAGSCELSRITLNQCSAPRSAESGFVPRVDYWSSPRWIEAKQTAKNRVEVTVYQAFEHGLPAKMTFIFNPSGTPFTTLQELLISGFIDYREFPNRVAPVELVPLPTNRLKAVDCPARLRGLSP
jgi:hypothetical protein